MTESIQLSEIIELAKGKKVNITTQENKNTVPYLLIDTLRGKAPECFTEDKKYTEAKKSDILMVFDGANAGLVGTGLTGAIGSTIARIRPKKDISTKYLTFFLSFNFSSLNQDIKGSAIPHIKPGKLLGLNIRFPPLREQQLIVSEIEKRFSRLDETAKSLASLKIKFETYKKSVLKTIFCKMPKKIRLKEIAKVIDIDHKMPKKVERGVEFISIKDFIEPDKIDFDNAKKISHDEYLRLAKKCNPECGDLIYSRIGTIGKVRKVPENKTFQISYSLCLIKLNKKVDENFIYWVLQSPEIFSQAIKNKRSIGVPDLGLTDIRNFDIPYTEKAKEKAKMVKILEEKFSIIAKLQESVNNSFKNIERLRKSILKSAFEGKLVK